ncbi:MAG TPA: PLP-dependent aminotransferase family protein, partial [Kiloniellales bacterium]|nr:PLP-dependent aminotransferase family protein [Kiloniellales bacterium]
GRCRPGQRLPTHRDLAWRLGVTVGTVSRAYAEAERRGLITGEVGRGTYVAPPATPIAHGPTAPEDQPDGFVDLSLAYPPDSEEMRLIGPALTKLGGESIASALMRYQPNAGRAAHRAAGAAWLERYGVFVPPERVVVTAGAQHGIVVALAALTRPGDRVLAESLCYPGIRLVAEMLGLRLEGLAMDEHGLLPEAFEAACRNGGAKALYTIPTLHNPTTAILPEDRRKEIAEIARSHDVAIVEDDILRLLAPDPPPTIGSFAPERSYFISGLSKTTAPGLRIGYLAGPEHAVTQLVAAVRATSWMAPPLSAEIAGRWILDGTADRILADRRETVEAFRRRALAVLAPLGAVAPPGSLHAWLRLPEPWHAGDFAAEARRRGVGVTPAEAFAVARRDVPPQVRICYSAARSQDDLDRALGILAGLLAEGPSAGFAAIV